MKKLLAWLTTSNRPTTNWSNRRRKLPKMPEDIGKVQTNVTNLSSKVGDVSSSLNELEQTVATADTALGQRIDSINVSVDGMAGE